jgi:hypothetical protein
MAKCNKCFEEIEFKPHPVSGRLTPFNVDGSIHFSTCSKSKTDLFTVKNDVKQNMKCKYCGADFSHAYWKEISNGQKRIRPAFKCGHSSSFFLAHTEYNISLIKP